MRIQETDRLLKESRYARRDAHLHSQENEGMIAKAWQKLKTLLHIK